MSIEHSGMAAAVPAIRTRRLDLVAITPECLRAEMARDARLGELLACDVTPEWPPEVWEPHVWELLLGHFAEHSEQVAWHRYILLRKPRILIGTVNLFRWTDRPGEAELGYAIVPAYWRRGLATEAAEAMVAWAAATGQVQRLYAHTYPHLTASIRILERCGFTLEGPGTEEGTVRYGRELG